MAVTAEIDCRSIAKKLSTAPDLTKDHRLVFFAREFARQRPFQAHLEELHLVAKRLNPLSEGLRVIFLEEFLKAVVDGKNCKVLEMAPLLIASEKVLKDAEPAFKAYAKEFLKAVVDGKNCKVLEMAPVLIASILKDAEPAFKAYAKWTIDAIAGRGNVEATLKLADAIVAIKDSPSPFKEYFSWEMFRLVNERKDPREAMEFAEIVTQERVLNSIKQL